MSGAFKKLSAINPMKSFKTYVETSLYLLKDFSKQGSITQGSLLHGHLIKKGISSERYIAIKLLIMYLTHTTTSEADQILKDFNGFDMVVHNCLIAANIDQGNLDEACKLFDEMPDRNDVSWTALISGFLKCCRAEESMWYFQRNPFQNVVSWTAAISGFSKNGVVFKALELFLEMLKSGVRPNDVTFSSVVLASAGLGDINLGMSIWGLIIKVGFDDVISISNSLITFCSRLGQLDLARKIFHRMEKKDVVSWTAMLDIYVEMGDLREARRVFDEMPEEMKFLGVQ